MHQTFRRILAGLFCLVLPLAAVAAEPAPPVTPLGDYFRETWRTADGLPHNLINAIAQTPDGYLWFATWEGLARYNGREFRVFDREALPGLSDSGIRTLHIDRHGRLWLGGARGSVGWRDDDGRWHFEAPAAGLVNALLDDARGRVWIATETAGLERLDGDGGRATFGLAQGLPADAIYSLLELPDGRLLVGTDRGLSSIVDDRVEPVPAAMSLPRSRIYALARAADGGVLVGTAAGLFRIDGDRARRLDDGVDAEAVTRILASADGELWLGTVNRGLIRLGSAGRERLDTDSGLPNNRVLALFRDRDGHMWVGTNSGLVRFRRTPFTSLRRVNGLPDNYVRAVLESADGSLWLGTSNGLAREVAPGRFEPVAGGTMLPGQSILSLADDRHGGLWIGTYSNGLVHWRDGRVQRRWDRRDGVGNEVRSIVPNDDGGVWVAGASGLARIAADGGVRSWGRADGLPGELIMALHKDRGGRLWVGTTTGLATLDEYGIRQMPVAEVSDAQYTFDFLERADGSLWLATDRGLLRYADGRFSAVDRRHGLPFDKIFNIHDDGAGHFWLGSNRGVLQIDIAAAEAVADGRAETLPVQWFAESDGMVSAQCNGGSQPSAALRRDGSLWFATAVGVATVDPKRIGAFVQSDPPSVVERLRVDGREIAIDGTPTLPAGTHRIEIGYAALGYVMPNRMLHRYRLEGFDSDWVERGNPSSAEFTNLPPGDYRFRVAASYPGGGWQGSEGVLSFSIAPLLWQRPLFWWLAAALLLSIAALLYRWRVLRLQQQAQQLRDQVEQRTADLRQQAERLQQAGEEKSQLLRQLRSQSEAFERQAREDALTGLANRRAFDEALAAEFARAERSGHPLALALADIDHFKRVNDDYSHAIGDEVLKRVADRIRRQSRAIDAVARWGGEEFVVLLPYTSLEEAQVAGERLRAVIERIDCSDIAPGLAITASVGIAGSEGLEHHERLMSRADQALYQAKQSGRNRVCVAPGVAVHDRQESGA